jgi:hypothetical protein
LVKAIDTHLGFTKEKGIQYSYFTFRKDKKSISDIFQTIPQQNVWRVVSYPIKHKGEERLFVCSGKERNLLRRLKKNTSEQNQDFSLAVRGDCVQYDGSEKREQFIEITRNSIFRILRKQ